MPMCACVFVCVYARACPCAQLQGAQLTVNVQVNESYEHMYSGDAHDLFCMSANRTGCPQRRRPQTKCWVARLVLTRVRTVKLQ